MTAITFAGFTTDDPEIVLKREGAAIYRLVVPFRYQDPEFGTITVPADVDNFTTDFASLPWFTTWFVPVFGKHVPAVVLHDALIGDPGLPTYSTRDGYVIGRDDADRIFLDAMKVSGTPVVQRLIMWSASSLATAFSRSAVRQWIFLPTVLVLSGLHLVEITDSDSGQSWLPGVPWVPESNFFVEWASSALSIFLIMSILGPLILSVRYIKATTIQAATYGLTFLPVLLMLPGRLLLVGRPTNLISR